MLKYDCTLLSQASVINEAGTVKRLLSLEASETQGWACCAFYFLIGLSAFLLFKATISLAHRLWWTGANEIVRNTPRPAYLKMSVTTYKEVRMRSCALTTPLLKVPELLLTLRQINPTTKEGDAAEYPRHGLRLLVSWSLIADDYVLHSEVVHGSPCITLSKWLIIRLAQRATNARIAPSK